METDESAVKVDDEGKEAEKEGTPTDGQKKKAEKEKVGYELENMSRVLPTQLKYLTFPDPRYEPVKRVSAFYRFECSTTNTLLAYRRSRCRTG
jgi:26S proteasome regulatory subunit N2